MLKIALVFGLVAVATSAWAEIITRHVESGKTTRVWTYKPTNESCENVQGTVTLISKPQYGTVANRVESSTFGGQWSRTRHCYGKPATGFAVTYTSPPGFRGIDRFLLDVRFPSVGVHRQDAFTIIVK